MRTVEKYHLAFYDEHGCYDEIFYDPWEIDKVSHALDSIIPRVGETSGEYRRLHVIFADGTRWEVNLKKG